MPLTLATVTLPDDLTWSDEFEWTPVAAADTRTLGGLLVREESALIAGRPITLTGSEQHGWITRTQLLALYALAAPAGATHLLTLPDARTFNVAFRRPALTAAPVLAWHMADQLGSDPYVLTLNLITV